MIQDTCLGYLVAFPPSRSFAYEDQPALLFDNPPSQMLHLGHILLRNFIRAMHIASHAARADRMDT